jgi:hypothetical protein
MAGQIPIKFAPAAIDSASHQSTEIASVVSNEAVERIDPAARNKAVELIAPTLYIVSALFCLVAMSFTLFGGWGVRNIVLTTGSGGRASVPNPVKGIDAFQYDSTEVLVLPVSNKDCAKKPDVDSLEFCIVMQGCPDTPATPGGRCGFEPAVVSGSEASVFYNGMTSNEDRTGICQREDNRKRIIASSGAYSRSITTYSVTCVGPECNFWKTKTRQLNESCAFDIFKNNTDKTPLETCLYLESRPTAWSKAQDGLSTCELFWPTLREVIRQKIPSTSSITDEYSQYVGGTFAISGPLKNDRDAWFNMCGFCSYSAEVKLYALHSRSRRSTAPPALFSTGDVCRHVLLPAHSYQQRPRCYPFFRRCSLVL